VSETRFSKENWNGEDCRHPRDRSAIKSEIRNAYIDFSQMTVSVLALVTDVMRQGKPVVASDSIRMADTA